ncbi:hypothetical protein HPB50_009278 [Hyalomma asiaticum]|uniref:Uncharacterized protein n=1 Tax=Hyalomma asiaticum TaxID=266040 RepID=A0ACB7TL69_HYAAI|nr:hypothetical protein HPB50_009278 [Hyalomma asiaticum]
MRAGSEPAQPTKTYSRMPVSGIGEYRLGASATWDEYVERLKMHCEANNCQKMKKSLQVLLSSCGEDNADYCILREHQEINARTHASEALRDVRQIFILHARPSARRTCRRLYMTALRRLAENYGFGDKTLPMDEMMRDRFVFGIDNEAVQQRLLAEKDLTFAMAYDAVVTAEATTATRNQDTEPQRRATRATRLSTKRSQGSRLHPEEASPIGATGAGDGGGGCCR